MGEAMQEFWKFSTARIDGEGLTRLVITNGTTNAIEVHFLDPSELKTLLKLLDSEVLCVAGSNEVRGTGANANLAPNVADTVAPSPGQEDLALAVELTRMQQQEKSREIERTVASLEMQIRVLTEQISKLAEAADVPDAA